jgi:hypothetical protein
LNYCPAFGKKLLYAYSNQSEPNGQQHPTEKKLLILNTDISILQEHTVMERGTIPRHLVINASTASMRTVATASPVALAARWLPGMSWALNLRFHG